MYGLFADMVQEYYGCMIYGCSIPKVRVLGSDADWMALLDTIKSVNAYFAKTTSIMITICAKLQNMVVRKLLL